MNRRAAFGITAVAAILVAAAVGYRVGSSIYGPKDLSPGGAGAAEIGQPPLWLEIQPPEVEFRTADGRTAGLSDYAG